MEMVVFNLICTIPNYNGKTYKVDRAAWQNQINNNHNYWFVVSLNGVPILNINANGEATDLNANVDNSSLTQSEDPKSTGGDISNLPNDLDYTEGFIGLVQLGLLEYRQAQPIMSKIGNFSTFSKTFSFLGSTREFVGRASTYVGTPLSIGLNTYALKNNDIGIARFSYRTVGDISSVLIGIKIGSAYGGYYGAIGGALTTGAFVAGEIIYDGLRLAQVQKIYWIIEAHICREVRYTT